MTNRTLVILAVLLTVSLSAVAAETAKPVRMGCGIMTFDTVPGWGLRPDGKSALGPTHGGVAIDKSGALLVADDAGNAIWRVTGAQAPSTPPAVSGAPATQSTGSGTSQ